MKRRTLQSRDPHRVQPRPGFGTRGIHGRGCWRGRPGGEEASPGVDAARRQRPAADGVTTEALG